MLERSRTLLKKYLWRIVLTTLGFAAAVSFLTLGFIKTAVVLICCGTGYGIGYAIDKCIRIPNKYKFWKRQNGVEFNYERRR